MARLLDRAKAEALLAACEAETSVAASAKATWDRALRKRAEAFAAANEGGLLVGEIAERCGMSVGAVKLDIGKAKRARESNAA
jgi:DNA-directed RNA polymerase specialized sigma24 family protein